MQGHIYDCTGPNQGDKYIKTTEKLVQVLGRKWSNGANVKTSIEKLEKVTYSKPKVPVKAKPDDNDDKEQEAADEYNADDDSELLSVSASNNTLSLVYRDPGTMRFVKYVGSRAPSSRWDIAMEYQVEQDDDDDEGDDDAKEAKEG